VFVWHRTSPVARFSADSFASTGGAARKSTIIPQQLSACGCHVIEKYFGAIPKPRLTRGFWSER
jgi:hypothetical protein